MGSWRVLLPVLVVGFVAGVGGGGGSGKSSLVKLEKVAILDEEAKAFSGI